MSETENETEDTTTTLDEALTGEDQETEAEPEVPAEPEPEKTVPLAVLEATRKQLQEQRDYWENVAKQAAKPQQPPPPAPDPVDFLAEPEKINSYIDQKVAGVAETLSHRYAQRVYGKETVAAAYESLKQHGTEAEIATMRASADPWGEVVDWHNRRQAMQQIGDDPNAWMKAKEAEIEARLKKELLANAAVREARGLPPSAPSMAGEPNLGARGADGFDGPAPLESLFR